MSVTFAEAALDDLRRLGPARARRALAQIRVLADGGDPGTPLAAGAPYRKLVSGADLKAKVRQIRSPISRSIGRGPPPRRSMNIFAR
jgi:hypothetical protein